MRKKIPSELISMEIWKKLEYKIKKSWSKWVCRALIFIIKFVIVLKLLVLNNILNKINYTINKYWR